MKCPKCGSTEHFKDGKEPGTGFQRYRCKQCNRYYNENSALKSETIMEKKSTIGMTLDQFREKHDVDYIVEKTLKGLSKGMIYEKTDVVKLSGLRSGYPGLSMALESATEFKGKAGGVSYWGHPDTISNLKLEGTMT